jgi:hypothetical protein
MTTIGTPRMSPTATRVMLLGSGELGKEVAIELQRFGCEVIAVDRYANAPAMQVAHRRHVINMLDGQALHGLVELERPHLIVPEIEAIATDTLLLLEQEGIQGHPDGAGRAPDHESRGHSPAGGRRVRIADLTLPLRGQPRGIRSGSRPRSACPAWSSR